MAKKTTSKARPQLGAESLRRLGLLAHTLAPQVRASGGLATALLALYGAKLETAEKETERLGGRCGDDAGAAYMHQRYLTQDLRGLVAILTTLATTLTAAERRADRISELTRRVAGGAQ